MADPYLEGVPPLTLAELEWARANPDSRLVRGIIPNPYFWGKNNPGNPWLDGGGRYANPYYAGPPVPPRGELPGGYPGPVPRPNPGSGGFPAPFDNGGTLNSNRFDYLGGANGILGTPPTQPAFGLPPHIPGPPSIIGRRPIYRTQCFPLNFRSGY